MKNQKQILLGMLSGLVVVLYCCLIALFMQSMNDVFVGTQNSILAMFSILLLLVFSATVTGSLVFGYPAYLFINKKFRAGLYVLGANLITIIILGIAIFSGVFLIFYQ